MTDCLKSLLVLSIIYFLITVSIVNTVRLHDTDGVKTIMFLKSKAWFQVVGGGRGGFGGPPPPTTKKGRVGCKKM